VPTHKAVNVANKSSGASESIISIPILIPIGVDNDRRASNNINNLKEAFSFTITITIGYQIPAFLEISLYSKVIVLSVDVLIGPGAV